jgi:hypothetical protein
MKLRLGFIKLSVMIDKLCTNSFQNETCRDSWPDENNSIMHLSHALGAKNGDCLSQIPSGNTENFSLLYISQTSISTRLILLGKVEKQWFDKKK